MSNGILDEVYAAREWLWNLGGETMRGVCEFLMECRRRADARGVKWIESKEELEAIGAEVRARLAAEELEGALCVREEREGYGRAEARGGRGSATKGTKKGSGVRGQGAARGTTKQSNDSTIQRSNEKKISGRKGAPAQSEVMR